MAGDIENIANNASDATNQLMGQTPQLKIVPLDSGTQSIMQSESNMAGQPSSYFSGLLNNSTDQAHNLAQGDQQLNQQAQQMGMSPGQMKAIRNVYNSHAQKGIYQLKQQNDMQGQMMKADYMSKLSQAMLGQQVTAANQYQMLTDAYVQQEQARAGFINSLFQTGDTAIGMRAAMNRQSGPKTQRTISTGSDPGNYAYGNYDYTPPADANIEPAMEP